MAHSALREILERKRPEDHADITQQGLGNWKTHPVTQWLYWWIGGKAIEQALDQRVNPNNDAETQFEAGRRAGYLQALDDIENAVPESVAAEQEQVEAELRQRLIDDENEYNEGADGPVSI